MTQKAFWLGRRDSVINHARASNSITGKQSALNLQKKRERGKQSFPLISRPGPIGARAEKILENEPKRLKNPFAPPSV